MKRNLSYLLPICLVLAFSSLNAQNSPVGIWKTIDDKTGEAKSHVEIYEQDGAFFGRVTQLLKSSPDKKCEECPGKKKDQPILGMVVLEALRPYRDYWKNGTILDPENGNEYGCSIWFENENTDELRVRGKHWTGLFRTQTWYRVK